CRPDGAANRRCHRRGNWIQRALRRRRAAAPKPVLLLARRTVASDECFAGRSTSHSCVRTRRNLIRRTMRRRTRLQLTPQGVVIVKKRSRVHSFVSSVVRGWARSIPLLSYG